MTPPGTVGTAGIYIVAAANLPTELAAFEPFSAANPAYRIQFAIMWYSNDWNAAATYPQVAYWFEFMAQPAASNASGLYRGAGLVTNASVSLTPTPIIVFSNAVDGVAEATLGGDPSLFSTEFYKVQKSAAAMSPANASNAGVVIGQNAIAGGSIGVIGASGKAVLSMGTITPDNGGTLIVGGIQSFVDTPWPTTNVAYFPALTVSGAGSGGTGVNAALNGSRAGQKPGVAKDRG